MREEDLARCVREYLTADGWAVYEEVFCEGRIADLVAVREPLVQVVEVKRTLGFALAGQALRWIPYAHLVSVAVPVPEKRWGAAREYAKHCLSRDGIGILDVFKSSVNLIVRLALRRRPKLIQKLRAALRPEQLGSSAVAPAGPLAVDIGRRGKRLASA